MTTTRAADAIVTSGAAWPGAWALVLPVKGGASAKSRLGAGQRLALAVALDTVESVLRCRAVGLVLAVTADPVAARACAELGAEVVAESRPGAGLNAAIMDAVSLVSGASSPAVSAGSDTRGRAIGVLLADVPAMRPADLDAALAAVAESGVGCAFVPDAAGTGTVLLASWVGRLVEPGFGADSATLHERSGARRLDLDLPRLRRDVDTPVELRAALAMGAGPRTQAAAAALGGGAGLAAR